MPPETPHTQTPLPRPGNAGRKWGALLAVAVLGVVVAAVVRTYRAEQTPSPPPLPGDGRYSSRTAAPDDPAQWLATRPSGPAGFVELGELPDDLAMPPRAVRRSAVALREGRTEWLKAEYAAAGSLPDVLAAVTESLTAAGWRCHKTQSSPPVATLVFHKDSRVLSVRLHWRGDSVNIVAVMQRAATAGPQ